MSALESTPWDLPSGLSSGGTPLGPGETRVDVCVIGAGIAGASTAYELARRGHGVMLLEADRVGAGETSHTTSHLASAVDDRFYHIESLHGAGGARICQESHAAAISRFEWIVRKESIPCDFRRLPGYLILGAGHDRRLLELEHQAAERAGAAVEWVDNLVLGNTNLGAALRFAHQGTMDPGRFMPGLTAALVRMGVRLHEHTRALDIESHKDGCVVKCDGGGMVRAQRVVVTTNSPVNTRVKVHTKQMAYRTFVIGLEIPGASAPDVLLWDTAGAGGAYHYVRTQRPNGDGDMVMLIVGGEDHRTGQADDATDRWTRLERWARERFDCRRLVRRWSGQVFEPVDGVAFIGRAHRGDDRVYMSTGDSGMGMTHGMIASMLLSDLIEGKPNAWAELYDPARVTLRAAGEYLSENLNTLGQYLEWLRPPRAEENRIPEPGHGSIVCKGLRPLAVYREPGGALHVCSAVCSHLGGLVSWNSAAESWDCPCHGSRFAPDGSVLTGPANRPLDRLPVETLGAPEVTVRPGAGASVVASGGGSAAGA